MDIRTRKGIHEDLHATADDLLRRTEEIAWATLDAEDHIKDQVASTLFTMLTNIGCMRRRADDMLVDDTATEHGAVQ